MCSDLATCRTKIFTGQKLRRLVPAKFCVVHIWAGAAPRGDSANPGLRAILHRVLQEIGAVYTVRSPGETRPAAMAAKCWSHLGLGRIGAPGACRWLCWRSSAQLDGTVLALRWPTCRAFSWQSPQRIMVKEWVQDQRLRFDTCSEVGIWL